MKYKRKTKRNNFNTSQPGDDIYKERLALWNKMQEDELNRIKTIGLYPDEEQGLKNMIEIQSLIDYEEDYYQNYNNRLIIPATEFHTNSRGKIIATAKPIQHSDIPVIKRMTELRDINNLALGETITQLRSEELKFSYDNPKWIEFIYNQISYDERFGLLKIRYNSY